MFERFTERARRVVVLSQEEARLLGHNFIGTEHLLLGLLHEGKGLAARTFGTLGVDLADARSQVEAAIGRGEEPPAGHVPFTARAKKVLETSLREAIQLTHDHIGTEHILLGLLSQEEGVGAGVLRSMGHDLSDVRNAVLELMSGVEPSPRPPSTEGDESVERWPALFRARDPGWTKRAKSGSPYEKRYGFSRGVRMSNRIEIAGTAPIPPEGEQVAESAYEQMLRCCTIAIEALMELGSSAADVIRTVIYITDPSYADDVGRAHGEMFGEAAPAATMVVVAALLEPDWKVEIEVYAQM